MKTQFNQPQGSTSRETNKEAIARIFGLKKSQVGYLSTSSPIDSYVMLFDKETQTCWYRGTATGTPSSWSISGEILTLITNLGTFTCKHATTISDLEKPIGASKINTTINKTVEEIIQSPYIITGRTSIKNPKWGAPTDSASDPAAATANTAAINLMLASSNSCFELDDTPRYINNTLLISKSMNIHGPGKSTPCLIFSGGDVPIIAQSRYANPNIAAFNLIRIIGVRITDLAVNRPTYWAIDLTNGHSNAMLDCFIDFPGSSVLTDKYGVALGFAKGSSLLGGSTRTFVADFSENRLVNGKLFMNTSDYYIIHNELWGTGRDNAVELGFGGLFADNQLVPGLNSGCFHFSDLGFDHDTMCYSNNYFDGNTSASVISGVGIKSDAVGLRDANITDNRFWFLNSSGISVPKLYQCRVSDNNFKDCDSDDTGDDDIICPDVYGTTFDNTHTRSVAAPKTGATRVNLGRIWNIVGKIGYAPSVLDGTVGFASAYAPSSVTNLDVFDLRGIGSRMSLTRTTDPLAANFPGKTIVVSGKIKISTGSSWVTLNATTPNLTTPTDLNNVSDGPYRVPDPTIHTSIPSGLTGSCLLETWTIADNSNYKIQRITKLSTGKLYTRERDNGNWSSWSV